MLKNLFKRQKLEPEAFFAYFNRLPEKIKVAWKKENGSITGLVEVDGFKFGTQARTPDEFILRVNEGVLIAYDTPKEYLNILLKKPKFCPPKEDWEALNDSKKISSNMSFRLKHDTQDLAFARY